ncbi:TPA: hypothetical protein ACNH4I_002622 [Serratia marcescens]|uniref:hypothetical protein n=1 Tax=Serratia nevei TaxID=2703794 RepID=UPI001A20FF43|nr:hypothetical protein [Serratia marcescens]
MNKFGRNPPPPTGMVKPPLTPAPPSLPIPREEPRDEHYWFLDMVAGVISNQSAGISNMALSKEEEIQRLMLLGVISQLDEAERNEIYALKDKLLGVFKTATKPELAMAALGLASADAQKEDC